MNLKALLSLYFLLALCTAHAQSSQGTRFWLGFMENLPLFANDDPVFLVSVDAEVSTMITISRPATAWSQSYMTNPSTITNITLPAEILYSEGTEFIDDKGFLIEASNPVKISATHNRAYFSESTLLLPENALGSSYILSCYLDDGGFSPSSFVVVATQNNTQLEITPSVTTLGGNAANVPFNITLNEGENYQVKATADLTGTRIQSLTGAEIAVFGGAQQANVSLCSGGADNHLYEQNWPLSAWDVLFYFVPFKDQGGDIVHIVAAEDNTQVFFDCAEVAILDEGEYYTGDIALPTVISSTGNIAVSQLNKSQSCNASDIGDPNMIQVLPIRYKTTEGRFFASANVNGLGFSYFTKHLVNVVTKTEDIAVISLDGNSIEGDFLPFVADPSWSYAQIQLNTSGIHELSSDRPFQAYSYGFGDFDAYSTALGYEEITEELFVCLDIEVDGLFCIDSLLTFSANSNLPIQSWNWNFGDMTTSQLESPQHNYSQAGSYTVTLEATFANGGTASASLDLEIFDCPENPCEDDPPLVEIAFDQDACVNELLSFSFTSNATVTNLEWDFGNGSTSSSSIGSTIFTAAGDYTIGLTIYDELNCPFTTTLDLEVVLCDPCSNAGEVVLTYEGELCTDSLITFLFPLPYDPDTNPGLLVQWFINGAPYFEFSPSIIAENSGVISVEFFADDFLNDCSFFGVLDLFIADCDDPCADGETLSIIPNGEFCAGDPMTFSYQTTADLTSTVWQSSTGETGTDSNFIVIFDNPGVYSIQLFAEDTDGCNYQSSIDFDIADCDEPCQNLPPIEILISTETCVDSIVSFDIGTTASVISFFWTFSTGQTFTVISPELSFNAPGVYSATLQAEDVDGCLYETISDFEIEICEDDPCEDTPSIEIILEGELCVNEELSFEIETDAFLITTFWFLDNGLNSNQPTFSFTPDVAGTYLMEFTGSDPAGCSYNANLLFDVLDCEEECNDVLNLIAEEIACDSIEVDFSLESDIAISSYSWSFSDGRSFDTESVQASFSSPGIYTIMLEVEAENACTYFLSTDIEVVDCIAEDECLLGFPNAFSPNDDGFNDQFRAYGACPPSDYTLQIFDRWGELIFETENWETGWDGRFRSEMMPTGIYVWSVSYTSNTGNSYRQFGDLALLR